MRTKIKGLFGFSLLGTASEFPAWWFFLEVCWWGFQGSEAPRWTISVEQSLAIWW